MAILSNTSLHVVQNSARSNALGSFSYLTMCVLNTPCKQDVLSAVQQNIECHRNIDVRLETHLHATRLAEAILTWLHLRGTHVHTDVVRHTTHEVLDWLDLLVEAPTHCSSRCAALSVIGPEVRLQWLGVH